LANKLAEQILRKKLKERGINVPKPLYENRTNKTIKPACKLRIIQPRGLTDFLPGIFSDSSSLVAAAVSAAFLITTFINHKSGGQKKNLED